MEMTDGKERGFNKYLHIKRCSTSLISCECYIYLKDCNKKYFHYKLITRLFSLLIHEWFGKMSFKKCRSQIQIKAIYLNSFFWLAKKIQTVHFHTRQRKAAIRHIQKVCSCLQEKKKNSPCSS